MTNDIESMIDGMTDEEAQYWGRWHAMMRIAHELGIHAQTVLLEGGQLQESQRLFFNRKERRRLTDV